MNRKEFMKRTCGCFLAMASANILPGSNKSFGADEECAGCTPCQEKIDFVKIWVERFMNVLDGQLDDKKRLEIMQENGRTCFIGAYGPAKDEDRVGIDKFIAKIQGYVGADNCYREGNMVRFNYVGNRRGLKVAEGYCLCPVIEDGPKTLSPTYCQCSVGYVGEMFGRAIGYAPHVELLESVRSGGKGCKFRIHLSEDDVIQKM